MWTVCGKVSAREVAMFAKSGWCTYKGRRYYHHHVAESYHDWENGGDHTRRLLKVSLLA